MLSAITKANKLLIKFLPLVLLIGLLQTNIRIGVVTATASNIGMILALCLEIVLYGKIISFIKGESSPSVPEALKQNAVNYLIVLVVLFAPAFCLQIFLRTIDAPGLEAFIAKNTVAALISCLSIYVFPIVFLKIMSLSAIPVGFVYLFKSLSFSLPLFGLIILRFALLLLPVAISINVGSNIALTGAIGIAINLLDTALMVLVFTAATYVIYDSTKGVLANEP